MMNLSVFAAIKSTILILEEGQPNFVEQNVANILRQRNIDIELHGKDMLPMAGEYNTATVLAGLRSFLEHYGKIEPQVKAAAKQIRIPTINIATQQLDDPLPEYVNAAEPTLDSSVHARPPGFCTGCPESTYFYCDETG